MGLSLKYQPKNQIRAFQFKLCQRALFKGGMPFDPDDLYHLSISKVPLYYYDAAAFFFSSDIALQCPCGFTHIVFHFSHTHAYEAASSYTLLGPKCTTY